MKIQANGGDSTVSVLLGDGDGTFAPHVEYATGAGPAWVTVADLNGDGRLDLAVACARSNTISVLLGRGDGTFAAGLTFPTGRYPSCVAVGDLDGDGNMDLVYTNPYADMVSLLLGNGVGTFRPQEVLSASEGPRQVVLAT